MTLNGLGRVLETLYGQGVRLDVTCRSQINTLADLSLLTKVRKSKSIGPKPPVAVCRMSLLQS